MKKYNVTVSITGSRFLGVMEAENMNEISTKVRKEGLAFDGICDDCIDRLDLDVNEVLVEEIVEDDSRCPVCKRECEATNFLCGEEKQFVMNAYSCDKCGILFGCKNEHR